MRAFIVTPSFESALVAELGAAARPTRIAAPGVVLGGDGRPEPGPDGGEREPIFARQILPQATEVEAPSVKQLAEAAYRAVEGAVDAAEGPFTLHAFGAPAPAAAPAGGDADASRPIVDVDEDTAGLGSRVELVGRQLLELLNERRRRAFRRYRPAPDAETPFDERWLLVQLLATHRQRLIVSAARPRRLPQGGTDLSPWPAGAAPVAIDRRPPSRAYQKLEEAFQWLAAAPAAGESCVDLGGAPGGWAWSALRRGARVTAVDRAPLEAPAAGHPNLTAVIGNAFTFQPPAPVDWLLCDVVAEPARSIDVVRRWLERGWCRNLVVTIKFKGRDGYGVLSSLLPMLAGAGWQYGRVKQLRHNKNEVTVMGRERL